MLYDETWDNHLENLLSLFHRLADAGLTVNLQKSEFGHARVTYLGHVVGQGHVTPIAARVEALRDFPVPTSRKSLRRFLGTVGFYRRFCPNFSEVCAPLTALISPKRKFVWSHECQAAFNAVRSLLMIPPVLRAPDFNAPFSIQVDASDHAVGAVLLQEGTTGVLHPVCYMSAKFKPHQRPYATIEKEALGLLMALEKFSVYVSNPKFTVTVYSDHNPLQFVNKMKNKNQRLMRWALALQPYNIEIKHIKGKENVIADALSRV